MPFRNPAWVQAQPETFKQQHLNLGYHPLTRDTFYAPEADRFAGTYVIGVQGTGKSGFLENLIHEDAKKGHAIIVIDPHGDLVSNTVKQLPRHRLGDTSVLDILDDEYPFGLNLFSLPKPISSEVERAEAVDRIMHVFDVLWAGVLDQQHLPRYLRATALTFLANPGTTLVDVQRFLQDPYYRSSLVMRVDDSDVRDFWKYQYDRLGEAEQRRLTAPLITRLESLFMGNRLVRNILGQRQTTINFRRAIEGREIILVNLATKRIPRQAGLIGVVLISQIHAALFSFADTPVEQRPGFSLYVDEFQNFATTDFAEMFSEGRKYGVRVVLAHQRRDQLPGYLGHATASARTKVAFRINPPDAKEMAQHFPVQHSSVDPDSLERHASADLIERGSSDPDVEEFIEVYLRPLQRYRRGHNVTISNIGPDWYGGMLQLTAMLQDGKRIKDPVVDDPLPYLDHLLFEVMRAGRANLPIPPEVVRGLANGGIGFFAAVRGAWPFPPFRFPFEALLPDFHIPEPLVVNGRWTRDPEGAQEQFYHCIFLLRQTMRYLAKHPIGKVVKTTPTEVAALLTALQNRVAVVRSGDAVGMIRTHNHGGRVEGDELIARATGIRASTRAKYCRAKKDVEEELRGQQGQEASPFQQPPRPPQSTTQRVYIPDETDEPLDEDHMPTKLDLGCVQGAAPTPKLLPDERPSRWEEVEDE